MQNPFAARELVPPIPWTASARRYRRRSAAIRMVRSREGAGSTTQGVGIPPDSFEGQTPGLGSDELVDGVRPPRSRLVKTHRRGRLDQVHRHLPKAFDPLRAREQGVVAAHRIQDQSLIGLEHIADMTRVVHGELHAQFVQPHTRTGALAVERQRHFRSIGQIERQVIRPLCADSGTGGEHALGRLAKRDRNDSLSLGKPLAGAQVERYAGPAPVVDGASEGDEGFRVRIAGHALFRPVTRVLPADDIGGLDRQHAAKHLVLFLADGLGLQRCGSLHRHEAEDLEQVRDHHVPIGSGLLVKGGSFAETQLLRHIDLNVVDEIAVPNRFEQPIGKTERENVLRRFLAEKVVDAENPVFVEYLVQSGIQRDRALQVGAEGLFHDDPRALDQARVSQQPYRGQGRVRRYAQVVKPAAFAVEAAFRLDYRRLESVRAGGHRHVVQVIGERGPMGFVHRAGGELGQRVARELAEAVGIEIIQRDADDPEAGDESRTRQMKHAGQQLAPREIARGAHQDDDLRRLRTHTGRYLCHYVLSYTESRGSGRHAVLAASRVCKPRNAHFTQGVGDGRDRLSRRVRTDRADTADAKGIDRRQLARVQNEAAFAHQSVELYEVI